MTTTRKALITGVTGQDGSFLTELLLEKGYEVHGVVRPSSSTNRGRIDHGPRFSLHDGDMTDTGVLNQLVKMVEPDEIYNLAGQSHVHLSFDQPEYTADADGLGALRLLEAVRTAGLPARFYQASTSEMFGSSPPPQREGTPFQPRSPYACAKLLAHWATVTYRQAHGVYACSGILFNHESPRRGGNFVTRKVTRAVAAILAGEQERLLLGNLDARRDWGHARDYVLAMWLMLQQPKADDYVVATGVSRTVRELVETAFGMAGLDWTRYVDTDQANVRPADASDLRGDAARARDRLGWRPTTSFRDLIREMLEHDLEHHGLDPRSLLEPAVG